MLSLNKSEKDSKLSNLSRFQLESFFLGLLESDGSIQVNHWNKRYLQYRIIIKLKNNDENFRMLSYIQRELKIGNVKIKNSGFVLLVEDHKEKIPFIMEIIEKHGLILTKKRIRYAFFQYCFQNNVSYSEYEYLRNYKEAWEVAAYIPFTKFKPDMQVSAFLSQIGAPHPLLETFKKIRPYTPKRIQKFPHFKHWLSGAIESEGCFSFRQSGTYSFSIGQKFEHPFIMAIKQYFALPNLVREPTPHFFSIETYNLRSVKEILEFCIPGTLNPLHNGKHKRVDSYGLLGYKETQRRKFEKQLLSSKSGPLLDSNTKDDSGGAEEAFKN